MFFALDKVYQHKVYKYEDGSGTLPVQRDDFEIHEDWGIATIYTGVFLA